MTAVYTDGVQKKITISQSSIQDLRCHTLYAYRHILRRVPHERRDPLIRGSLIHVFLEHWLVQEERIERSRDALAAMSAAADELGYPRDSYDWALLQVAVVGYAAMYNDHPHHWKTLMVEAKFAFDVAPGVEFVGRIDGMLQRADGTNWLIEHKTTAAKIDPASRYWDRLALDAQISAYYLGSKSMGYDINGCIYDVIRIPPVKPHLATPEGRRKYKANGELYANQRDRDEPLSDYRERIFDTIKEGPPSDYYARRTITRLDSELERSHNNLLAAGELVQLIVDKVATKGVNATLQNDKACHQFGVCEYWDVCNGAASIDDNLRFRTKGERYAGTTEDTKDSAIENFESEPWEIDDAF